jgi:hypothetical protein
VIIGCLTVAFDREHLGMGAGVLVLGIVNIIMGQSFRAAARKLM